jgi:hypothetical protein
MNKKMLGVAIWVISSMVTITDVLARSEFVIPTGATGCIDCHFDEFGTGFKPGVLTAFKGGLPGLKEFLHPTPKEDSKPVIHAINNQYWDVTVGDAPLVIALPVSDAEDDMFTIKISPSPLRAQTGLVIKGAVLSQERTDMQSNLRVIDFKWQPTAAQANKTYGITFYAEEKGAGRKAISNEISAIINVWPTRKSATKNVSQFKIQRAQWSNNALNLAGAIVFKNGLTAAQRSAALKSLNLNMRTNSGFKLSSAAHLTVDTNGNWKKTVSLKGLAIPCVVKLEYEGLNATSPVKLAPKKTCLQ